MRPLLPFFTIAMLSTRGISLEPIVYEYDAPVDKGFASDVGGPPPTARFNLTLADGVCKRWRGLARDAPARASAVLELAQRVLVGRHRCADWLVRHCEER